MQILLDFGYTLVHTPDLRKNQTLIHYDKETIDIGFLPPPIEESSLALYPLQSEKLLIALPHSHTLAEQQQLTLNALAKEPFIVHPRHEGSVLYEQFLALCRAAGFEPMIVYEDSQYQTRLGLVAAGIGITFVPESLKHLRLSRVTYCKPVDSFLEPQLAVAWRKQPLRLY